jgi:hypothetical protein
MFLNPIKFSDSDFIAKEKFVKAQAYGEAKSSFGAFESVFEILTTLAVFHFALIPFNWQLSGYVLQNYFNLDLR